MESPGVGTCNDQSESPVVVKFVKKLQQAPESFFTPQQQAEMRAYIGPIVSGSFVKDNQGESA